MFPANANVANIDPSKMDRHSYEDFLKGAWPVMKKSIRMVCDAYFSSGQNCTPDQLDPKDFWKMTAPTKGGKPSAE
eukprot:2326845-Rhodomonas_salina.1